MADLGADRYELYRVITDWDALHEGFRDRVEELEITRVEIDLAGNMTPGYSAKLLCDPPIKSFGRASLPRMLKATKMVLLLAINDERFKPVREQLAKRKRPSRSIVRRIPAKWLMTSQKATEMSRNRWSGISPQQRSKIMKKVRRGATAAARARRRKAELAAQQEVVV